MCNAPLYAAMSKAQAGGAAAAQLGPQASLLKRLSVAATAVQPMTAAPGAAAPAGGYPKTILGA